MKALTSDEIQHLAPAEQEVIATVEVSRLKKREELLKRASGECKGKWIIEGTLAASGLGLYYFGAPTGVLVGYCIWGFGILISLYNFRANQRIDALLELLEVEKQVNRLDKPEDECH